VSTESPSGVLAASAEPGTGAGSDGGTGPKLALAVDAADADGPAIDVTRLRVALARLSRRLRRHELAGLTPTQLAALATVGHSGPMRLGDLAAAEGIAPSTLTRLVTALEDSGYVRRCADPSDARASTLAITAHGQDALARIRVESTLALAASMQLLAPAQRAALADALPVLEQLAEVLGAPGAPGSGHAGAPGPGHAGAPGSGHAAVPGSGHAGAPGSGQAGASGGGHAGGSGRGHAGTKGR
jgi:DNA-binding MarR family transcriptional regulator